MPDWVPPEVIEAMSGSHNAAFFLRVDTTPPLRLALGVNDMEIGIPVIDEEGAVYTGAGVLQDVPDLEVLINGQSDRIEFTLSGVDPDAEELAELDAIDIRGKQVFVGMTTLDQDYQPMSPIIQMWDGTASFISERSAPVVGTGTRSLTLALSVGAGNTMRKRISAAIWSHAHQRALYPTDDFCKGTARLARGVAPSWPRF
jgi:hypothetical protein